MSKYPRSTVYLVIMVTLIFILQLWEATHD